MNYGILFIVSLFSEGLGSPVAHAHPPTPILRSSGLPTHAPGLYDLHVEYEGETRIKYGIQFTVSLFSEGLGSPVAHAHPSPSVPHPEMSMVRSPLSLPLSAASDRLLAAGEQIGSGTTTSERRGRREGRRAPWPRGSTPILRSSGLPTPHPCPGAAFGLTRERRKIYCIMLSGGG